jgi:dTDP-4-dehydrorhamnose 3,5-epimerase
MDNQVSGVQGSAVFNLPVFPDERGFFKEIVRLSQVEAKLGKPFMVKQVNHARSAKNTLRGIHAAPWNKLLYVVRGKIQSVVVDCRKDSPTFGKYQSIVLGEEDKSCLLVPAGCGNSYLVLSEDADYVYLTDQEWAPNLEKGFAWNDPAIAVRWQIEGEPLLSEKDKNNPSFSTVFS